jgi:hypothetical protein
MMMTAALCRHNVMAGCTLPAVLAVACIDVVHAKVEWVAISDCNPRPLPQSRDFGIENP